MSQYIAGTEVILEGNFTDGDGDPADPTAVSVTIRLPDQTVEDLSDDIVHLSLGHYRVLYTPVQNGLYEYRFAGEGAIIVGGEKYFTAQTVFPEA